MGKTLHIIPSGIIWPLIVEKWIGDEPDKANHEVIQYPVPTNLHYQPDALTDVEMMKTAISWHKPNSYSVANLYQDLMTFIETVKKGPEYDKVIVWHAEDADSRLLLYLFAHTYKHRFYAIDARRHHLSQRVIFRGTQKESGTIAPFNEIDNPLF